MEGVTTVTNSKEKAKKYRATYMSKPENVKKVRDRYKKYYHNHNRELKDKQYIRRFLLKMEVMMHYSSGLLECEMCGENRVECLSIDHVEGGGNKQRKELGTISGEHFYTWLKANNFPTGFRVLCMNCQFIEAARLRG